MTTALVGYYDNDSLRLRYRCNTAPTAIDAFVLYEYDKNPGVAIKDSVPTVATFTTNWSEVETEGDPTGGGGGPGGPGCKIVGGGVFVRDTAAGTSRGSLYVRLVIARQGSDYEECLCCGYADTYKPFLSIGEHEPITWQETVAQMDVTYTQANVAGGAILVDVTPGSGNALEIRTIRMVNSGTNGFSVKEQDTAATNKGFIASIASGAGTTLNLSVGSVGTAAHTTTATPSGVGYPHRISGTDLLSLEQTVAGAQNDTLRVLVTIVVRGALPTVTKARSTNQADVTVTAGAASFAFIP